MRDFNPVTLIAIAPNAQVANASNYYIILLTDNDTITMLNDKNA